MPKALFDDPDGALEMLRDSVRSYTTRQPGAISLRRKRDAGADVDAASWAAMAESGWTTLMLPEALGGSGLGMREQAVLSEALGAALVAEPIATVCVLSSVLLAGAPPSVERERLGAALAGGAIVTAALSDGIDPLRASSHRDAIVLNGRKSFVDAARSASDILVAAEGGEGPMLLGVPASARGLTIVARPTVDGATVATLSFADVALAPAHVLARGPDVAWLVEAALAAARVAASAELAGIASAALERTIDYAKQRVQFSKPIASFQVVQHRLVDMWADVELARAALANAVEAFEGGDARARQLAVYAAKARCGDAATSIGRRAVHLHGAMGFTDEADIGLFLKRAITLDATLGQAEAMRLAFIDLERAA